MNSESDSRAKSIYKRPSGFATAASGNVKLLVDDKLRVLPDSTDRPSPFHKSLFGDLAGTNYLGTELKLNGMLYRARLPDNDINVKKKRKTKVAGAMEEASMTTTSLGGSEVMDSDSESDDELNESMNPRLQLAITLKNWSSNEQNHEVMMKEGGVHALVALADQEDVTIRKCVAGAFYNLSSNPNQRKELIAIGAAKGAIKIAKELKSWNIARLCALTLTNFSLQKGSEEIVANDGAIFALLSILGLKGHRLLPVCVQALYNLTCVDYPYRGMERITKALVNVPQTGFDHMLYLVKCLANCSRFSRLRSPMIEDGALAPLATFAGTIVQRTDKKEAVCLVATVMRLLSDTPVCRNEMVAKGSVELLFPLVAFGDEESNLLIITAVHNLIQSTILPAPTLNVAVLIVTEILLKEKQFSVKTAQYSASCMYLFTKDHANITPVRISGIIEALPRLFWSKNSLTEYFALSSTLNLFLLKNTTGDANVELLVRDLVDACPFSKERSVIQAASILLARLSQDKFYVHVLEKLGFTQYIVELLLDLVAEPYYFDLVQESACVSICRLALQIFDLPENLPKKIIHAIAAFMESDDVSVLCNNVASIRYLLCNGVCQDEFLANEFYFVRVASIIRTHREEEGLCRNCCAILTVFSYRDFAQYVFRNDLILDVLLAVATSAESFTQEVVASALCNISTDDIVRNKMVEKGVGQVISLLSGSTREVIQELCAILICNITFAADTHKRMVKDDIMQTLLMIALVRSVTIATKRNCASALLNLLSNPDNSSEFKRSGAVRIFASLSSLEDEPTQVICARSFLVCSAKSDRRDDLIERRSTLESLFEMIKGTTKKARLLASFAVCNLLSFPTTRNATIRTGGLMVIKIIATIDVEDLCIAVTRVIISLVLEPSVRPLLARQSLVPILVLFLQHTSINVFENVLYAISCMCQYDELQVGLIAGGCVSSLVSAVIERRISNRRLAVELCRALCLLSYQHDSVESMVSNGSIMIALHLVVHLKTCSPTAAVMIAIILQNLSYAPSARKILVQQDALKLLNTVIFESNTNSPVAYKAALIFIFNMSSEPPLHGDLIAQGIMGVLWRVVSLAVAPSPTASSASIAYHALPPRRPVSQGSDEDDEEYSQSSFSSASDEEEEEESGALKQAANVQLALGSTDVYLISKAISLLSLAPTCCDAVVEGKGVDCFTHLFRIMPDSINEVSMLEIASALCRLTARPSYRETIFKLGAMDILILISRGTSNLYTQNQCSLAIAYLSELTNIAHGIVELMLVMSVKQEEYAVLPTEEDNDVEKKEKGGVALDHRNKHANSGLKRRGSLVLEDFETLDKPNSPLKEVIKDALKKAGNSMRSLGPPVLSSADSLALSQEYFSRFLSNEEEAVYDLQQFKNANMKFLHFDYEEYQFVTINRDTKRRSFGLAPRVGLDRLPHPDFSISAASMGDPVKRFVELSKVTVIEQVLQKETFLLPDYVESEANNTHLPSLDSARSGGVNDRDHGPRSSPNSPRQTVNMKGGGRNSKNPAQHAANKALPRFMAKAQSLSNINTVITGNSRLERLKAVTAAAPIDPSKMSDKVRRMMR